MELPYADDRELIMDILKYVADVEVVWTGSLKKRVRSEIQKMADTG
ncbi:MAG: WYL domain-containing protein [Gammaproteobacteria bacterium]|nr:WYL domain-containing protein [Gammaproteobacteria bacterium]MBU3989719.1 WYL domain-containing protein [Gammaproteobacteria bacterium]MBU4003705.1 WYL domain-containing protein [Gammaproteobacteria bacterium]MBU4098004.1 WYL domain-containing protein [Gammaproteobacteria bacterium]MBU4148710.1 WYL domain-containing protein [Gammaproteobacteria bacterium]